MKNKYSNNIIIHDAAAFAGMRKAGNLAARVLDLLDDFIKPGVKTIEINDLCHNYTIKEGGVSAQLNYKGFPKSVCTSVNHVVCHGIPGERTLDDGDIVSVDVTCIVDGWYGDSCRTYLVGDSFNKQKRELIKRMKLVKACYESLVKTLDIITPGIQLSDIAKSIQNYIENKGFSVVREYTGHGIGRTFHTEPTVLHYYDALYFKDFDLTLQEGMFFTVEPMVNEGASGVILSKTDNWTVSTRDKSLSAQFEHTIGVTNNGCEIFTLSPAGRHYPEVLKNIVL